ncbi:MAG TPA: butyrate kinase [Bacteroidetes bacterium]|uniref:Probable butyrate kinase n=1 Tax=candidate division TA06 bacterium TaxID=2250710 RepID=A0A660SC94_UNCT6|nr:MAG: butyrate kinase [candidate division TA06 bacterium]HHD82668.1 butyrate kinase [Bacteroidota bacterium]
MKILAINPGATSTKLGLYEDTKEIFTEVIRHKHEELEKFDKPIDQLDYRNGLIEKFLMEKGIKYDDIDAVIGRGGLFHPLESGTYIVNEKMIKDIKEGNLQDEHISNIGALLAKNIADKAGVKAYITDPVCVDEFEDVARITGLPEFHRKSLFHALNIKYVSRKAAKALGKDLKELNLIVAHLGTGISIVAQRKGRVIDTNNPNDEGPFCPQRVGTLPTTQIIKLCYSGKYTEREMIIRAIKKGGMYAHLGTDNVGEVVQKSKSDTHAKLILDAMCYNIAKTIGAQITVLKGDVDAFILTGGIVYNNYCVDRIKERIIFMNKPVFVYPGEDELIAMAESVYNVESGIYPAKDYE